MARPEEKAQAMMNKWVAMREAGNKPPTIQCRGPRPILASSVEHLSDAEYYRNQLVREISQLVAKIQNPGLGEHTIRDVNDTINRKLREKYHWNLRIHQLGGVDYNALEKQRQMEEGDIQSALVGAGGYRYFGAAKDLPGVQEFFVRQAQRQETQAMKRNNYNNNINGDYFGWREEEDGVLLEMEAKATKRNLEVFQQEQKKNANSVEEEDERDAQAYYYELLTRVPTQEQVAQLLLEEKKRRLLQKFA
jgi:pre-mRNA-splicing factor ISY1